MHGCTERAKATLVILGDPRLASVSPAPLRRGVLLAKKSAWKSKTMVIVRSLGSSKRPCARCR
jgi:hypothetical protein